MKKRIATIACASLILALAVMAGTASVHEAIACSVPRKERQPQIELQQKLKAAGWNVKRMQVYNGCYEAYGIDENGKSIEAFFDPGTLERIQAN